MMPLSEQLNLEKDILRNDNRNWCIINVGTTPDVISVGISGKDDGFSLPVVRRFSGGGTIVADKNTIFITFIGNNKDLDFPVFPRPLFKWTCQFYDFIPGFNLHEQDYAIGNKKFGGNAQYLTKERWLHHSSLLWDFDINKINLLPMPKKQPKYRQKRSHEDFLCKLCDYFPSINNFINLVRQNNLLSH